MLLHHPAVTEPLGKILENSTFLCMAQNIIYLYNNVIFCEIVIYVGHIVSFTGECPFTII